MGLGAVFILLIVLIVVAVLGGAFYVLSMWLRGKKLAPEEDKLEGPRKQRPHEQRPHPEHVEVENEQRTRFVGSR